MTDHCRTSEGQLPYFKGAHTQAQLHSRTGLGGQAKVEVGQRLDVHLASCPSSSCFRRFLKWFTRTPILILVSAMRLRREKGEVSCEEWVARYQGALLDSASVDIRHRTSESISSPMVIMIHESLVPSKFSSAPGRTVHAAKQHYILTLKLMFWIETREP